MVKNLSGFASSIIPSLLCSWRMAIVARDQSKCNASAAGDLCASVVRHTGLMPSLTLRHAVSLFETGCRHTRAYAAHGRGGTLRVICSGTVLYNVAFVPCQRAHENSGSGSKPLPA